MHGPVAETTRIVECQASPLGQPWPRSTLGKFLPPKHACQDRLTSMHNHWHSSLVWNIMRPLAYPRISGKLNRPTAAIVTNNETRPGGGGAYLKCIAAKGRVCLRSQIPSGCVLAVPSDTSRHSDLYYSLQVLSIELSESTHVPSFGILDQFLSLPSQINNRTSRHKKTHSLDSCALMSCLLYSSSVMSSALKKSRLLFA